MGGLVTKPCLRWLPIVMPACSPVWVELTDLPIPDPEGVDAAQCGLPEPGPASGALCRGAAMVDGASFDTIQTAIDAARAGQRVEVCPGTHVESLTLAHRATVLVGTTADPADTVIVPPVDSAIEVLGGSLVLAHVTLRGGMAVHGGGIRAEGAEVALHHTVLQSNTASGAGGAVWSQDGCLDLVHTSLIENRAGGSGGAVFSRGPVTLQDSHARQNQARYGGALHVDGDLTVVRSELVHNLASEGGGAITARGTGEHWLHGVLLEGNQTEGRGGAVWASGAIRVERSAWLGNRSSGPGGALCMEGPHDGSIVDSWWEGNAGAAGAALYVERGGAWRVQGGVWAHNEGPSGESALRHRGGDLHLSAVDFLDPQPRHLDCVCGTRALGADTSLRCVDGVWVP